MAVDRRGRGPRSAGRAAKPRRNAASQPASALGRLGPMCAAVAREPASGSERIAFPHPARSGIGASLKRAVRWSGATDSQFGCGRLAPRQPCERSESDAAGWLPLSRSEIGGVGPPLRGSERGAVLGGTVPTGGEALAYGCGGMPWGVAEPPGCGVARGDGRLAFPNGHLFAIAFESSFLRLLPLPFILQPSSQPEQAATPRQARQLRARRDQRLPFADHAPMPLRPETRLLMGL